MSKKISKKEAEKQIEEFFKHIKEKTPEEVKKIKKLAMSFNIKLQNKRHTFCDKCFKPYVTPSIRIKRGMVTITCEKCRHVSRWKLTKKPLMPIDESNEEDCEC